ncbi:MAG: hypothetical protein PHF84_00375 [bacterium]|nr:hypothetical protein [bacterium]
MLKLILKGKDEYISIEQNPYTQKGHTNYVKLWTRCPVCSKPLTDDKGHITLLGKWNDKKHGIFTLSDKLDDFTVEYPEKLDYKKGIVVEFFCPHCKSSLQLEVKHACSCGSPTVMLHAFSSSIIQFCSRSSCKEHKLYLHRDDSWAFVRQVFTDKLF